MKPEVSIMPERAPVYVPPRPQIRGVRRSRIFMAHGGKCGLCGEKIFGLDYDIEHRNAREISADDTDDNLYPAHKTCHAVKTKGDRKLIAKTHRQAGETGQQARRQKRGHSSIKGPKFPAKNRKMDGSIGLTKRAQREAAYQSGNVVEGEG